MGERGPKNFTSILQMIEKREILNNELQYLKEAHNLQNIPWFYIQNYKRRETNLRLWNRYDITIGIIEHRLEMLLSDINELLELSKPDPKDEKALRLTKTIEKTMSETAAMIEFIKRCFIQRMEGQYQPPSQPPNFKIECIPGMGNLYKACDNIADYFMHLLDVEFHCVFKPLILIGGTKKIDVFPRERIIRLDEDFKFRSRFLLDIAHEISHLKVYEIVGDMRRICYNLDKEEIIKQILGAMMKEREFMKKTVKNFREEELAREISRKIIEYNTIKGDLSHTRKKIRKKIEKRINYLFEGDPSHTYSTIEDKKGYDLRLFKKMEGTFEKNEDKYSNNKKMQFIYELHKKMEKCAIKRKLNQEKKKKFRFFVRLILDYLSIYREDNFKNVAKVTDFMIYVLFGLLPKKREFKEEFKHKRGNFIDLLCDFFSILIGTGSYVMCASTRLDDEENQALYEGTLKFIRDGKSRHVATGFFKLLYHFVRKYYPTTTKNLLDISADEEIPRNFHEFIRKRNKILAIDNIEIKLAGDRFEVNAASCLDELNRCFPDRILYNLWIIHQRRSEKLTREGLNTAEAIYCKYKYSHLFTMEIVNMLSRGGGYG